MTDETMVVGGVRLRRGFNPMRRGVMLDEDRRALESVAVIVMGGERRTADKGERREDGRGDSRSANAEPVQHSIFTSVVTRLNDVKPVYDRPSCR